MLTPSETARRVEAPGPTAALAVEVTTSFVQWGAVIAGALVAAAVSLVLIAFGTAIGLSVVSSSPTWRDASPALAIASGLYLLLTALASFGVGGYVAGRLRERWDPAAINDLVEFRDGVHGALVWAIAVVVTGLVIAASAAQLTSKAAEQANSPATTTGEPLLAYELDKLFRAEKRPTDGELTYSRGEAGRILLASAGRQGITSADRAYLARLIASRTGIAQPDAERRVDEAVTAANVAVQKARRSAVILGFSTAASLLLGAAAAWYAASLGGRESDGIAPSASWGWPRTQRP
jgi:hypothetical protein